MTNATPTATRSRCCAPTGGVRRTTRPATCCRCSRPGMRLLDVGCGPGTITMDLAELRRPERSGDRPGAHRGGRSSWRAPRRPPGHRERRLRGRRRAAASTCPTLASTWCTPTRCSSTSTTRCGRCARCAASAARAAPSRCATATTAAFAWYPAVRELDRWLEVYAAGGEVERRGARRGTPAAVLGQGGRSAGRGRRRRAPGASRRPTDRAWWGGLWADRVVGSDLARQAVERGVATAGELTAIAAGWRRWAEQDDGWFSVLHGEIVARA